MSTSPTIIMVAGEPSGDIHGARLVASLKQLIPDIRCMGIGGERMIEQGFESIIDMRLMSVVGFWEVAKRYRFFKNILSETSGLFSTANPSVFVPIDYPGFNMRLAASARKHRIPVVWYIAPQLWAWGKNRARQLANITDELLVVFPFETEFFTKYGINTTFVGHPLLDDDEFGDAPPQLSKRDSTIALLPGSRSQEVQRHLPIMARAADILRQHFPKLEYSIATSPFVSPSLYSSFATNHTLTLHSQSRALMKSSQAGIVKTGTSTLEAALCGMPFTMMYRTSALSYHIARNLITLDAISLVNILAKKSIVQERIQQQATPEILANDIRVLLENPQLQNQQFEQFCTIRALLGNRGASHRAAERITRYLS